MKQKDTVLDPENYYYIAYKTARSYDIVPGSLCAIGVFRVKCWES